jgi:4-amino-4-deoxy-L-arabinose transferase-like glycosyltransferase
MKRRRRSRGAVVATTAVPRQTAPTVAANAPAPDGAAAPAPGPGRPSVRARVWVVLAVAGLLLLHYALAAHSLLQENPTIDEVAHLPAGVTYWQKTTFRLYHHNPPLVKLVAALPVVWSGVSTEPLYELKAWKSKAPDQATFAHHFAAQNAKRYFELFQLARLSMPLFSVLGGVVVFMWSRRLYGKWGGLLSLALWVFCPNVLAHGRLITSDMGSTAFGVAATYVFWTYLQKVSWHWAVGAGVMLGLAQLTKFSMLLLYAVFPFLWLAYLVLVCPRRDWLARGRRGVGHGIAIVAISFLTIDAGYLFEGVGIPLGRFEFGSRALTTPVSPGTGRPESQNQLFDIVWKFRVNRFRKTLLAEIPCPLPEHYVLGFDEQKIETEGIPDGWAKAVEADRRARERAGPGATALEAGADNVARILRSGDPDKKAAGGYPVYLNGALERTGWWYYYALGLLYKIPEGTWLLVALSLAAVLKTIRSRTAVFDELTLWTIPLVVFFSMSFLTDINLGLRYVLAILPYIFIAIGKVVPWILSMNRNPKRMMGLVAAGSLALTLAATARIAPNYLAYFNWTSGGPDREPARLIDSNLDWGQDLVGLQKWCRKTIPDQPIGLAYFGQINPSVFAMRGEPLRWYLPPVRPGTTELMDAGLASALVGPAPRLEPGYYAVSRTALYGLPWRFYDPAIGALMPEWNAHEFKAYSYFQELRPEQTIGHSINIYRLSADDAARLNASLGFARPSGS